MNNSQLEVLINKIDDFIKYNTSIHNEPVSNSM